MLLQIWVPRASALAPAAVESIRDRDFCQSHIRYTNGASRQFKCYWAKYVFCRVCSAKIFIFQPLLFQWCVEKCFLGQCACCNEYRSCNNMLGPLHQNQHSTVSAYFFNSHWCFIHYSGASSRGGVRMLSRSHSLSAKPQVCRLSRIWDLFCDFMQAFRLWYGVLFITSKTACWVLFSIGSCVIPSLFHLKLKQQFCECLTVCEYNFLKVIPKDIKL